MNKYLSIKIKNLSFISILLVVIIHSNNLREIYADDEIINAKSINTFVQLLFYRQLCEIAVPLFLIISGYLFYVNMKEFNKEEFLAKYKSRFYSLFIPYVIWCIYGFLFFYTLQSIPQLKGYFNTSVISNMDTYYLISKIFTDPFSFQLWFVRDLLLIIYLLSPIIYLCITKTTKAYLILSIIGILWLFKTPVIESGSIFFFMCGALIAIKRISPIDVPFYKYGKFFFASWILLAISLTILTTFFDLNYTIYGAVRRLTILWGIYSVWCFYDVSTFFNKTLKGKVLKYASYSFFIYLFHEPLLSCVKRLLLSIFGKSEISSLSVFIVTPIIIVSLSILIAIFLKKYASRFYYILTGNR